ncbi:MAG: tetratricopeptide repeat protein [Cyanobacteria bacterium J06638_6]
MCASQLHQLVTAAKLKQFSSNPDVGNRSLCDGIASANQTDASINSSQDQFNDSEAQANDELPISDSSDQTTTEDFFSQGGEKLDQNDYQGAIKDYTQAVELNPRYAEAYNNRGVAYARLGDRQSAIADYDRAIGLNPDYALAYANRGSSRRELGEREKAAIDYWQAAQLYQQQGETEKYNNAISQIKHIETATYRGDDYTITITGFEQNAAYRGCNRNNECLEIAQPSEYSNGSYVWENNGTQYRMQPNDNGSYRLRVTDAAGKTLVEATVRPGS